MFTPCWWNVESQVMQSGVGYKADSHVSVYGTSGMPDKFFFPNWNIPDNLFNICIKYQEVSKSNIHTLIY